MMDIETIIQLPFTAFDNFICKREIPAENTAIKEEKYIK